jgi:hypothetical protein
MVLNLSPFDLWFFSGTFFIYSIYSNLFSFSEVQVSSTGEQLFAPNVDSPNSILSENLEFTETPVSNTLNLEKPEDITNPPVEPQPPSDDSIQAMEVLCGPQLVPAVSVQENLTIDELANGNVNKRGKIILSTMTGEIKRDNTGGCKGICMCLDCVLFRTHAERSFEFSKQQLNEAEEIIRSLVTEICSLRYIVEKSTGNRCSDSSQVYQVSCVNFCSSIFLLFYGISILFGFIICLYQQLLLVHSMS